MGDWSHHAARSRSVPDDVSVVAEHVAESAEDRDLDAFAAVHRSARDGDESRHVNACSAAPTGGRPVDVVASCSYVSVMRAVGLKILKNKLSEYVRLAAGGETVLITDHDRVVAEIVPPRGGRNPLLADAMMADLVRQGLITPAALPPGEPPDAAQVTTFEELMRELAEDRADRDLPG